VLYLDLGETKEVKCDSDVIMINDTTRLTRKLKKEFANFRVNHGLSRPSEPDVIDEFVNIGGS